MNFTIFNRIKEIENNKSLNILFLNLNEQIQVSFKDYIELKNYGNLFVVCKSPFQIGPLRGRLGHLNIKFILSHQIPPNINFDIIIVDSLENEKINSLIEYFNFKYVYTLVKTSNLNLNNYYKFDENCFRLKLNDITDDSSENNEINNSNVNVVIDADEKEKEEDKNLSEGDYDILVKGFATEPIKYDKYRINYLYPVVPGKVSIILIISKLTDTFFDVIRDIKTQNQGLYEFILIDNAAGFRSNVKPSIRYGTKMPLEFCQYHAKEISTGEYMIMLNEDSPTFQVSDFIEKGIYETR